MNYILSRKLLYSAEDGRIVLLGEPHVEVVVLSPIPNRILMVLIENQGEIVSRDDFFVKVWDQHGKTGSANTLKQYIGLIRRILDSHLDENCIITVPGKGYSFSSVVDITTDAGEICEPHQIGIDEITSVKKTYSCRILKRLTCTILKKKVYVFSSVFFFLAVAAEMLILDSHDKDEYFTFAVNGCIIHSLNNPNGKIKTVINNKEMLSVINTYKIKCTSDDKIYFFTNIKPNSIAAGIYSVLAICSKLDGIEMQCVTYRVQG